MPESSTHRYGEVISASICEFTAQCMSLHEPPAFGSFVNVGSFRVEDGDPFETSRAADGTIYGLVHEAMTGSIEQNRRPAAYGLDEEALRREQPQIFELLATDFSCLIIAHVKDGRIKPYLPPAPPRIHSQVSACEQWEIQALSGRLEFLRTILQATCSAPDELIAATLRYVHQAHHSAPEFLVHAGREITKLLHDDYGRVDAILSRLTA